MHALVELVAREDVGDELPLVVVLAFVQAGGGHEQAAVGGPGRAAEERRHLQRFLLIRCMEEEDEKWDRGPL
jgi:hypothetical protein